MTVETITLGCRLNFAESETIAREAPAGVRFLLVDGSTAGLWRRKKTAKRLEVAVAPAARVNRTALKAEAERFAAFLGLELALTVG